MSTESMQKISLDMQLIRQDFPLLQQTVNGAPLIYLDNSNTTQKPQSVIEAMNQFYLHDNANIHRSVYRLSERATIAYENARTAIQNFIHAKYVHEIIFVRGTTEAINLVANSFGRSRIKAGDEILISAMEHHSNIVPWQLLCEQTGATLKVIPIHDDGTLDLAAFARLLNARTKLLAITHVSNALGTINPVQQMIKMAHEQKVPVLLDGAQATPHMPVDVQELDCDFYAFSAHKMYGPTGIGVLYGKTELLEAMPPYHGGGNMINQVTFEKTTYNVLPYKFEAGTANIAGVIGFGAAIAYLNSLGMENIAAYEQVLLHKATKILSSVPGLRLIGTAPHKAAVSSFVLADIHPHDVGTILDAEGIAVRVGHHCAMPLMERFQVPATVRASVAVYNTEAEIEKLAEALLKVKRMFS